MQMLTHQSPKPLALPHITGPVRKTHDVGAILLGRRLLDRMLKDRNLTLEAVSPEALSILLNRDGAVGMDDLHEAIGSGSLPASTVIRTLQK